MDVEISVVVPVYQCGPCLDELWARTTSVLDEIASDHEIIFVDDASPDDAGRVLTGLAARDRRVVVVSLPENQGQPAAIAAGLSRSRGRWTAVMDGDLQDPPEALRQFLAAAREGADIVVGRRSTPARRGWRRPARGVFLALARGRHRSRLIGTHGVFSVLSRRALAGYLRRNERFVMYLPVIEALQLPVLSVDYRRADRARGSSSYDVGRLLRRAWRVLRARPIRGGPDQR